MPRAASASGASPSGEAEPRAARLPPLFWYESDPVAQSRFAMALLLYWHGRERSSGFDILAPLYYRSHSPDENFRVLLPFHFKYASKDGESLLWGPYFHRKSLRETTRFLVPFYFHTQSPDGDMTYAGLYFRQKSARLDARIVFPLYWNIQFPQTRKAYQTVIPFYFLMRGDGGKSRTLVSPLFWAYKDEEVSQGFVPPYYWRHKAHSKVGVGFPLYWRFYWVNDEEKIKDVHVAFPWYRYQSGRNQFRGVFPLYLGRTRVESEDSEESTGTLKTQTWDLFFPLYYGQERPDGSRKRINPLFSRFRDPDGTEYGHDGLHFFARDPWGGKTEGLLPFLYYREEADFFKLRFLLLYLTRDAGGERFQLSLFPVFRYRRDSDRRQVWVPGFYRDRDPDRSRGLFLAYYWRTDWNPDAPEKPVVLKKRFLIPLLWHYRDEERKTTVAPPLVLFHSRGNDSLSTVLPFYFNRTRDGDSFTVIPPFIARESPERKWAGLFFLYWQSARTDKKTRTFFPLVRYSRFRNGTSWMFPGVYYLSAEDGRQGFVVPYFWDHRGKTQYEIFAPLYVRFQRPDWNLKTLFPVYKLETARFREKGFFPLVARTADVRASTDTPKHFLADSHRVLPFYFYRRLERGYDLYLPVLLGRIEKELDAEGRKTVRGRMLLFQYWERSPDRFVSRMDPLFAYENSRRKKGFSIPTAPFPLWQYEVDGRESEDTRTVRGAFFPYYWKETKWMRRDLVLPLFYRKRLMEADGKIEASRKSWLLLYYASRSRAEEKSKLFVVPLYWRMTEKKNSRTIVPPVWTERGENYARQIVFPLWWRFEKDRSRTSVFFPLFLKASDPVTRESTVLAPGYWSSRDEERSLLLAGPFLRRKSLLTNETLTVVFPLYAATRSPERSSRTVFPLFWSWKEKEKSVSYLFPLYFSHQKKDFGWRIAFPLYWNFRTAGADIKIVPPYFAIKNAAAKEKTYGVAPLWTYQRSDSGESKNFQVLGGLFGYERKGPEKTFRILFIPVTVKGD